MPKKKQMLRHTMTLYVCKFKEFYQYHYTTFRQARGMAFLFFQMTLVACFSICFVSALHSFRSNLNVPYFCQFETQHFCQNIANFPYFLGQ